MTKQCNRVSDKSQSLSLKLNEICFNCFQIELDSCLVRLIEMAISYLSTLIHTIGLAIFGYSLYYDLRYVYAPPELIAEYKNFESAARWPGKWKYLTIWNVVRN